jgi:hypothetical protein
MFVMVEWTVESVMKKKKFGYEDGMIARRIYLPSTVVEQALLLCCHWIALMSEL